MTHERGIKVVGARRGPNGEVVLEIEASYAAFSRLHSAHLEGELSDLSEEETDPNRIGGAHNP